MLFADTIPSAYKRRLRAVFVCLLIAIFLAVPQYARSSTLKGALDKMFMSNATGASSYNSQTRGGFVGGSLVMRSPVMGIPNIVSFDPPRLNAGCGGIDLFGGSFSFINTQQIIAIFRTLVANAVGVLFKAAINVVNQMLGGLMTEFQSIMQALNMNFRNTCAIANQVLNMFSPEGEKTKATEDKNLISSTIGSVRDFFSGIESFFTKGKVTPSETSATAGGSSSSTGNGKPTTGNLAKKSMSKLGNLTWRALVNSQAAQRLGTADQLSMEIALSLIGSEILSDQGETTGVDSQSRKNVGLQSEKSEGPKAVQLPPTIHSMRELIEGPDSGSKSNSTANDSVGDRPLSVYKCNQANAKDDEFGCDKPTVKELKSSDFPGTRQYVLKHLIGESGVYSLNSLIGKLMNCTQEADTNNNICGFTAEQKNIIEVAKGVPLLTLLKRGQGDMNTTLYIAQILAPLVTEDYTLRMMETMITVVGEAYRDVELSVPQTVQGNIQSLRLELQQAQTQYANRMASVKAAVEMVNHAVSQAPGMWMSLPSSVGISPRQ